MVFGIGGHFWDVQPVVLSYGEYHRNISLRHFSHPHTWTCSSPLTNCTLSVKFPCFSTLKSSLLLTPKTFNQMYFRIGDQVLESGLVPQACAFNLGPAARASLGGIGTAGSQWPGVGRVSCPDSPLPVPVAASQLPDRDWILFINAWPVAHAYY